jgi:superfamily I DNA/RNA helicase
MTDDVQAQAKAALDRILGSASRKKLVVAGPGAGKTYLFDKLLDADQGQPHQRLVLTFINTLKEDLFASLGDKAEVATLHGYCQRLLHQIAALRTGLTERFQCYPGLRSLIAKDWEWLDGSQVPQFVKLMRDLECTDDQFAFYVARSSYYDAIDFDDSVFRTYRELTAHPELIPDYSLVLIDEFQDFNKMEAGIIDLLASKNRIVIAGDDDQALYSRLRGASWDYIRNLHAGGEYDRFELPFCMRCPEVVVGAVNDLIAKAGELQNLQGRIAKPYRYYAPVKGADSALFPHIDLVQASVHRLNANYFGKYIEKCIRAIPQAEKDSAAGKNEPIAMVIGSDPYRTQVKKHLIATGILNEEVDEELSQRDKALQVLSADIKSNLGWRIMLACGPATRARDFVRSAAEKEVPLYTLIPDAECEAVSAEAASWLAQHGEADLSEEESRGTNSVAITSYEGSKGRAAQYVFLVGLHSKEMPRDITNITDIEICKLLVGLTRTKRKCDILHARNANGNWKNRSEFLGWIRPERFRDVTVNAQYFA